MKPKNLRAQKVEDNDNGVQVCRLPNDLLNHVNSEKWVGFLVGLAVEQDFRGLVRRERKRGKSVHN